MVRERSVTTNYTAAATWLSRDATLLREQQRFPGADHLLGLAAECVLKSVLIGLGVTPEPDGNIKRQYRQHLPGLLSEFRNFSPNPYTQHFPPGKSLFDGWRVDDRYSECAHVDEARLQQHEADAQIIFAMFDEAIRQGHVQS